jgi:triosephosphate isomerase
MERRLFIAGNWKMNMTRADAESLATGLVQRIGNVKHVDLAVCPPFVYLTTIESIIAHTGIEMGAQNVWYEENGAYTGEISESMLKDVGCRYVIIGHSERRHVIGETDELINRKILKALDSGLDVIFCVGELLEEREGGNTEEVVTRQIKRGLEGVPGSYPDGVSLARHLTIAYEPVWAIGTGKTATPDQAQEVHAMIRRLMADLYDNEIAADIRIQYGGSVKPANAKELLQQADVDGALVGGASLKSEDFAGIVNAGVELSQGS